MKKIFVKQIKICICLFLFSCLGISETFSQESEPENQDKLTLSGDVRFRAEQDWDSRMFDGSFREDRFRLRHRLRIGLTYKLNSGLSMGASIRSGVDESIQSPHNNLGHKELTGYPVNIYKVYLKGEHNGFWCWAGKNSFPFWKQNELFWDDDVMPEGIALGTSLNTNTITFKPKAAFFITNTGSGDFDPRDPTNGEIDGHMLTAQMELAYKVKKNKITIASGYYGLRGINNVPTTDFFYEGPRYKLDYSFIVSGIKIQLNRKHPITLGVDHFINMENYDMVADSLLNPVYKDQKNGLVLSAKIGKLKNKGDWLFAYYYAHKEELSVVSYYSEDDWSRFGTINRNRNTNYRGHEIRLAYAFSPQFNVVARAYFVQGLVTPGVATESNNRIRIDFNMRFDKEIR